MRFIRFSGKHVTQREETLYQLTSLYSDANDGGVGAYFWKESRFMW